MTVVRPDKPGQVTAHPNGSAVTVSTPREDPDKPQEPVSGRIVMPGN
jgi:hypothetical protein